VGILHAAFDNPCSRHSCEEKLSAVCPESLGGTVATGVGLTPKLPICNIALTDAERKAVAGDFFSFQRRDALS
jgi:hypothetical protein